MHPGPIRVAAACTFVLLAACTPDRMTSPGPSPVRIAPEVQRVLDAIDPGERDAPVAVLQADPGESGGAPRLSAAHATLLSPGPAGPARTIDPGVRPSFNLDESELSFIVNPSGGRPMLFANSVMKVTFRFFCYDSRSGQWNQLLNVNVNSVTQRAVAGTGGHQTLHSLATKPVGTWSRVSGRTAADGTFLSDYTAGIASGDEQVRVNWTTLDAGSPCAGMNSLELFNSAVRYRGLVLMAQRDGLVFWAIDSDHNSLAYATQGAANSTYRAQRYYKELTEGTDFLSMNAASLIYGGINDVNNDWQGPHETHRVGTDVDIDGSADTQFVWDQVMLAGTKGGFARCEVHNLNHVHCYHTLYP